MTSSRNGAPAVSVIIPSYESQATARATLVSLRNQTFRNFETLLIDSGPSEDVTRIAVEFPEIIYHRSNRQLLPHAARNLGTELARGDILVFTDPDIVAAPDWLEKLVASYERLGSPVSGAVASLRLDWLDVGTHLAKFDIWLPSRAGHTVPVGASVNFLCPRRLLQQVGGFDGGEMIGDTLLSWDLIEIGQSLHFDGRAIVYHDHRTSFRQLLRERFVRGEDFGRLRSAREDWTVFRTIGMLAVTILPMRLAKLLLRSLGNSIRGRCVSDWLRTLPIIAAGHAAWLAGEARNYCTRLQIRAAAPEAKHACM